MPFWAHHRGEKVPLSAPVGELLYSGWCFSSARMALLRVAPYSSSTACSTVELMSSTAGYLIFTFQATTCATLSG